MEKPAIEGGAPVRKEKIYYGRQWIDEEDIRAVTETLQSDYITCGPQVTRLEREIAKRLSVRYAVAVSSGTAALHCACLAAGIGPGDEVITTPLTFAASANCALYCGARPVFADIDPGTYNIDPASIERCVTPRTRAVIAVDYTGQAVLHAQIRGLCERHGLLLIEDAAHAIGTNYAGKPVGSIADMTCFSFHPVKTITAGEGGIITTEDEELYRGLMLARTHGITHDEALMEDLPHEGLWCYEQLSLGYNYRMTDFQAALLCSQLKKLDRFKERRRQIAGRYDEAFADIPQLILQRQLPESDTCRHLYVIRLNLPALRCTRRQFFDALSAEGIQPQVHYVPVYWFPYYRRLGYERGLCPVAEKIYEGILSIPLYPKMTDEDVDDVIRAVRKLCAYYGVL